MTQPAEITSRADWALLTQNLHEFYEQIDALYLRITDPGEEAEQRDGEKEDPAAEPESSATAGRRQPEPHDAQPDDPQREQTQPETEEPVAEPDPGQNADPFTEAENAELQLRRQQVEAEEAHTDVEQDDERQRRLDYESDGDYDADLDVEG